MRRFLFAGGYIHDAQQSYELSKLSPDFFCTIGIHPCRAQEPFKSTDGKEKEEEEKNADDDKLKRETQLRDYIA